MKTTGLKLSDIRPCDGCGGRIAPVFHVIEMKIAAFNPAATNEVLGLAQYFGGALALAEAMAPRPEPILVLDEEEATVQLFICNDCYCRRLCLGELAELRAAQIRMEKGNKVVTDCDGGQEVNHGK